MKTALVLKSTGSNYIVKYNNEIINCKIKGKFRIKGIRTTNPVAVGDIVDIEQLNNSNTIVNIHQRKNYIIRKATNLSKESHIIAANIDQAILLATMAAPVTELQFIDRFLITAEAYKIPAKIIFNKTDIYMPELIDYMRYIMKIYQDIGYQCLEISVKKNTNIDKVVELLKDKKTVITGNSGVGKSSLINAIDDSLNLKISEISEAYLTGKHTTTFAEMFELKTGGYIIDTPGIKGFGIIDMQKSEIPKYFPEMFELLSNCKFYNCSHIHEPNCAVKEAVENNKIAQFRYLNYISMMQDSDSKYRENNYL